MRYAELAGIHFELALAPNWEAHDWGDGIYSKMELFDMMFRPRAIGSGEVIVIHDHCFPDGELVFCRGESLRARRISVFHHEGEFAHIDCHDRTATCMNSSPTELWNAWRATPEIQQLAEAWITKRAGDWTEDDERLYALLHSEPARALASIFAVMQLTDDQRVLGGLAAGPFEDFLGVHGEAFLETIHVLALEHRRLREVLDGVWQGAMPKHVWHRIETLKQRAGG